MKINPHQLKGWSRANLGRYIKEVSQDWIVILAMFLLCAYAPYWPVFVIGLFVIGSRQHALGIMGHDGVHYGAMRHPGGNDLITNLIAMYPIGISTASYRKFHFRHHRYLGSDQDPEREIKLMEPEAFCPPISGEKVRRTIIKDALGLSLPLILRMIYFLRPVNWRDLSGIAIYWVAFFSACWYFDALWIYAMWVGSLATGFWLCFRLRVWTEHTNSENTWRFAPKLWQRLLFLPHHTYCHYEHHQYSSVPSWNLPTLRQHLAEPQILSTADVFAQFSEGSRHPKVAHGYVF